MPVSNYTTKTTGKVRKLADFECPMCGNKEEHWEDEKPTCDKCMMDNAHFIVTGQLSESYFTMRPVFTTKNNAQRAYVRDKRRD